MKREYKLSSIVIVTLIGTIVSCITTGLFDMLAGDNSIISLLGTFLTSIIGFFFQYAIAAGLIRNRMGSVGEYLNQINTINGRFFLINILLSLITIAIMGAIGSIAGSALFFTNIAKGGINLGVSVIVLLVFLFLLGIGLSVLLTYTNFYLADENNFLTREKLGTSIKNIIKIGKDLFAKTLVTLLIYIGLPVVVSIGLLTWIAFSMAGSGLGAIFLISLIILGLVIYILFASALVQARLSDHYLDYREVHPLVEENI